MGEIKVPQLGESVVEATVARWVKQPGEPVQVGDALLELETEKVNVEVAAEEAGTLEKVLHDAGATVKVGEVVGVISNGAGGAAKPEPVAV
ncbi:MAG TPA: biotin/lipoyl-containing protein, partial [Chloroflexota bacterium]|nr:biotin/lipoyl-containing protein [Chloroflexota bacterium]